MIKEVIKKIVYNPKLNYILKKINNESNIILIGSPLHGNIGDHAISIAEIELLKKSNKNIVEIPGVYYNLFTKKIVNVVKKNDIIVITGGGFIGTLWKNEEEMIRSIITNFPNNKILIMPQTVYFENSLDGKKELEKSKQIYNSHKNLYMFLREEKSYEFCKKEFKNMKHVGLVPDIVGYLNCQEESKRDGALFCLRKDKEKILSDDLINKILDYFKQKNIVVKYTTTVIDRNIDLNERKDVFENKLKEFREARIVITDRLHGMIFAAITGTPCIAFDNLSGKVRGVYKWFSHLNYISIVDGNNLDLKDIEEKFNLSNNVYDNLDIRNNLEKILEYID